MKARVTWGGASHAVRAREPSARRDTHRGRYVDGPPSGPPGGDSDSDTRPRITVL